MEPIFCPTTPFTLTHIIDVSFAPRMLFYSYLPIVATAVILGFFVVLKNRKSPLTKTFLGVTLTFALLVANELAQWIIVNGRLVLFSWHLTALLQIGMVTLLYRFVYIFLNKEDLGFNQKALLALSALPVIASLGTTLNISSLDLSGCEGVNGYLWSYVYILEIVLGTIAVFMCIKKYRGLPAKTKTKEQAGVLACGTALFFVFFLTPTIAGDSLLFYEFNLIGPLGMLFFLATITYMMVRFGTFNIKLLATQALVWALWAMIGAILFVAQTDATRIVTATTEAIAVVFGIMLIKTVRKEVAQREELQQLTQELAQKNQKLQELDVQKSQFLSFASHDLKSPVNVIKQFASLILDKTYSTPEKIMETAQKIKSNAERAVGLVDDFLDLRRLEDGKMEYAFEKKNVVTLVHDIVEDFKVLAKQQKNIDVIFTSTRNEVLANLDVSRFSQVIQNLLSNSLKYTELGTIAVNIKDEQSTALIEVKDTGIGMSAELIPTLFEQFHRAPGVAKKIQGTGLGLYISKQIVLGHGGEIWVSSEGAGKGSSFFVRIKKA